MLSRPLLDRVAFLGISWYAVLIVGAMVIGYFLASNEARRLRLPQDTVIDFMLYAVPLGIICARLYYVAFRFNDYSDNLLSVFNIREGGLAIYGGVIGGLIAAKLVSRKHKISMLTLLDVVAPALVLGQGIGRWGNYINMEAYACNRRKPAILPLRCGNSRWRRMVLAHGDVFLRILLGHARLRPADGYS
ncbi:MAG: prolipoprotein diacylglyceryl transferase [Christensenellales bacterium]